MKGDSSCCWAAKAWRIDGRHPFEFAEDRHLLTIYLALKLSFILSRQTHRKPLSRPVLGPKSTPPSPQIVQKKPQAAVNHVRNGRGTHWGWGRGTWGGVKYTVLADRWAIHASVAHRSYRTVWRVASWRSGQTPQPRSSVKLYMLQRRLFQRVVVLCLVRAGPPLSNKLPFIQ